MRKSITEQKEITKIEEVIIENIIQCNKCGTEHSTTGKNLPEFYDAKMQNIHLGFGYGSQYDTESWKFDLCEDCLLEIIKSFKVVPDGFMQYPSYVSMEKDSQKVFDLWKITGEWHTFINYTVEELEKLRGSFKDQYVDELIEKCNSGRLEY